MSLPRALAAVALLALAAPGAARANDKLAEPYQLTVGDMVALETTRILKGQWKWTEPMAAHYDRKDKSIEISIVGPRTTFEEGRTFIEGFKAFLDTNVIPAIAELYGVELTQADFTLVYVNKSSNHPIARRFHNTYSGAP